MLAALRRMDNYKVLKRLGKGAQGSVFLVQDKVTGQKRVLKKVECSDETEANKAFKEAVALQSLKHPYICGYKEFFMMWDKEEHAIFVCIVMDYYKLGDLEHTLKQRRAKKEALEELILKKWIGQMIEALSFVHEKKMIHRDLKPSNIFLKDDLAVTIGDFGVATVMGNIRTMTRTCVGSMSWMAPEILDASAHYDERTDVWSLGCIILEMATCSFMDSAQISGLLFQLKDSPQLLKEALETVAQLYSVDLCQLIRTTLRIAFHQRPTARELVELPFVQECLALSNSPLYKGPRKDGEGPNEAKLVPKDGGVDAVIAYMEENGRSAACLVQALQFLQEQTESLEHSVGDVGKRRILQTMRDFSSLTKIQTLCCQVLSNIAVTASAGDVLFTKEFIVPICTAMRSHAGSVELQTSAATLIMTLSSDEGAAGVLGQVGAIQDTLTAMRSFPHNLELVSSCCTALWSLSVIESNMSIITKEKGVQDICSAMQTYGECRDLVDAACSALWSLSMEVRNVLMKTRNQGPELMLVTKKDDDNLNLMADLGVVELLLQALDKHCEDAGVSKFACAALSSLAEMHDISAFYILRTESGVEGIPIILRALSVHAGNGEVVENVATLFQELANYEEIREELTSMRIANTLAKMKDMFAVNEDEHDASTAVSNALAALKGERPRPTSASRRIPSVKSK